MNIYIAGAEPSSSREVYIRKNRDTKVILNDIDFTMLQPLQLVLIGFALFVSGGVYRYSLLVVSGVLMWGTAALAAHFDLTQQYLIRSIAEIVCFIIPVILMYSARKKYS